MTTFFLLPVASFRVNTRNRILVLSFEFLRIIYLTVFSFSRTGRKTLQNELHGTGRPSLFAKLTLALHLFTEGPDTDAVTTSIISLDLSFLLRFSLLMTDLKSSRTDLFNFASLISSGEGTTLCLCSSCTVGDFLHDK